MRDVRAHEVVTIVPAPRLPKARGTSARANAALAQYDRLCRTRSDHGYVRVMMALNAMLMTLDKEDLARYYAGLQER